MESSMAESGPPATFRSPVQARPGVGAVVPLAAPVRHSRQLFSVESFMTRFSLRHKNQSRGKSIVTTSKIKQWVLTALALLCLPVLLSPVISATTTFRIPAEDGAALFGQKCALCHGKDGKGLAQWRAKGQPDFTDAHF